MTNNADLADELQRILSSAGVEAERRTVTGGGRREDYVDVLLPSGERAALYVMLDLRPRRRG